MLSNYEDLGRGARKDLSNDEIFKIIKSINSCIACTFVNVPIEDNIDMIDMIDLSHELLLTFEYKSMRIIKFCNVVIWSDGINDEREEGHDLIPLETWILNEISKITRLISKTLIYTKE